ncbi:glycosyltransferase [Parabacteroides bouchesdurhonensis]|uniref:glycosyltransferase n=1 Tax=Parabacteroides bouchesdurhonensis TaxID=1936995 RepID=UPI000C8219C1|nr:glycosyltransferase [Parabacteroides bouchesdurhonensis]
MKILILNTSEQTGGAAVAANRLMHVLQNVNVEVKMLVHDKTTKNQSVVALNESFVKQMISFIRFLWERLVIFICNLFNRKNLFQVSIANTGIDISDHPLVREADIIHLHWINQGFLSLNDIQKLIAIGKPIVWTLHDLWPATGICHYPDKCIKYRKECYRCPMMVKYPLWDLAKQTFHHKLKMDFSRVTFVGCSQWIASKAKESALLQDANFTSIPNPIDTSVFKTVEKKIAREHFNLPLEKKMILFAAAKLSDTRKGAKYFIEACNILKQYYSNGELEIILMGNCPEGLDSLLSFKVNALGYISDVESIVKAYNCADMFVIPSLEDNLPNTIMEAMACGVPCVGFNTGGIPEMIDHCENGYVADYMDVADLAKGIRWVLDYKYPCALAENCVTKVQNNYMERIVAGKYIILYENLLQRGYC